MYRKALVLLTVFFVIVSLFASFTAAAANDTPATGELAFSQWVTYQSTRHYDWTLQKTVDRPNVTLQPGQTTLVNYTVTAAATGSIINPDVKAEVKIENKTGADVSITGIDVSVPNASGAPEMCVSFPYSLPAGQTLNCMIILRVSSTAPTTFQATVHYGEGQSYALPQQNVTFGVPYIVQQNCFELSDGAVSTGTICIDPALDTYTKVLTKSEQIGPYATCGTYQVSNTASFVTWLWGNPKPQQASAVVNVDVPCAQGCSLTPGYWKTHSSYGPAAYDDTWAQIGEDTPFFGSGKSYYQALWTNPAGNAYYILAHAYIAARLNQLNGADVSVIAAQLSQAEALLASTTTVTKANKAQFTSLAFILDQYNNGLIGPGHCK